MGRYLFKVFIGNTEITSIIIVLVSFSLPLNRYLSTALRLLPVEIWVSAIIKIIRDAFKTLPNIYNKVFGNVIND